MDKFQDIWKEQCVAARGVRAQHGILSALDYLIGEKPLTYAEMVVTRPEFARELPRFVAEVRDTFNGERLCPQRVKSARLGALLRTSGLPSKAERVNVISASIRFFS